MKKKTPLALLLAASALWGGAPAMALIKRDYHGEDLSRQAKKIALERSPSCRAVWPETAE